MCKEAKSLRFFFRMVGTVNRLTSNSTSGSVAHLELEADFIDLIQDHMFLHSLARAVVRHANKRSRHKCQPNK